MSPPLIPMRDKLARYLVSANGCWEWRGSLDRDGYGVVAHHRGTQLRAHRASYAFHVGEIPHGMCVCHSCDNRRCINPSHLFIGTNKDNTHDAIRKGRLTHLRGNDHPLAKLTDAQVSEIRSRRSTGEYLRLIAKDYGISFQHVSALFLGTFRSPL